MKDIILITGASGFLGSSLIPYLRKQQKQIVTHSKNGDTDINSDLSDFKKVNELLGKVRPSIIINLAGLTDVDLCEKNINLAFKLNTHIVENISNWIKIYSNKCHLIQISTDHVYDSDELSSEDNISLKNNYSFSKYAAEIAARQVDCSIIRTNFVGYDKSNNHRGITSWLYKSVISKEKIKVFNDIYFNPLSIDVLVKMIEQIVIKKPIGTYNLGSHNGMSKGEFAINFLKSLSLPLDNVSLSSIKDVSFLSTYRPRNMLTNCTKFERELNIKLPKFIDLIPLIAKDYNEEK